MKRLSHYWYSLPVGWRDFMVLLLVVAAFVAVVLLLTGCVSVPTEDGGSALVPGWGGGTAEAIAPFLPSPFGEILKIAGLVVAGRATQSALTKSGRANYAVVADPDVSWGATAKAVLHNTIATSSPPEARAKMENPT